MINLIIFSKNRAMQLDALLRSIKLRCNVFNSIHVVWTADEGFERSYTLMIPKHNVTWIKETNFKEDTMRAMTDAVFTCFMCDDNIIMHEFNGLPDNWDDLLCHSLRMEGEPWKWRECGGNEGYPFSVDGHIYKTKLIKPLINNLMFINPNKLESQLQHKQSYPDLMSGQFILTSISLNRVSSTSGCDFSGQYSERVLDDMFLDGKRIDLDIVTDNPIIETYPLKFIDRTEVIY